MVAENYAKRLLDMMIISSEHPYNPGYDSLVFDQSPRFSFLNLPLLIMSMLFFLYTRNPRGCFLIFVIFIFLLFSTFVPSVMVPVHLLIMAPVVALLLGGFFDFLIGRKKMIGISLLSVFIIVNCFFILYTMSKINHATDLTYLHCGLGKLEDEPNDVYVVGRDPQLYSGHDIFYFSTKGKNLKILCDGIVDCGIREGILHKEPGTKFLFSRFTIDYLDLEEDLKSMVNDDIMEIYFEIRNRDDAIAYVYERI
jgi:hypothetical protein